MKEIQLHHILYDWQLFYGFYMLICFFFQQKDHIRKFYYFSLLKKIKYI